ncbi:MULTISPECIES: hypothetical protein [Rhodomicrobium]|uniref:hypothetical protein n=1 Tax=Rhodomicrobium TaxID=1068 RepID=UPI000B4B0BCB|nr:MULTISPECIES: hypothetical protein [Rhodomicrobium]
MTKNRAPWLILIALAMGLLLWLDRGARQAGNEGKSRSSNGVVMLSPIDRNPARDAPAARPIHLPDGGLDNPLAELDIESLSATVERPLFAPSRRPAPAPDLTAAAPPPIAPPAPPPPAPPNYTLLGVIKDGGRAVALLRNRDDGRNIRVEAGDVIGTWEIANVRAAAVSLRRADGALHELRLAK